MDTLFLNGSLVKSQYGYRYLKYFRLVIKFALKYNLALVKLHDSIKLWLNPHSCTGYLIIVDSVRELRSNDIRCAKSWSTVYDALLDSISFFLPLVRYEVSLSSISCDFLTWWKICRPQNSRNVRDHLTCNQLTIQTMKV